jgi:membrane-bound lytic murein transglycosylase B
MTHKEFTIWLKGFAKAANSYNITPAQWEAIVEELDKVVDDERPSFPFGVPNFNLEPIKMTPPWCTTTTDDKTILHD